MISVCLPQASSCATVVVYVMDTSRSVNPVTFMSNMLYACSILYKTKLPFLIAMNKVQVNLCVETSPCDEGESRDAGGTSSYFVIVLIFIFSV